MRQIEREFGAYDGIADNYPKYVLSMDKFDMSRNGIIHQNIIDFLLENLPQYKRTSQNWLVRFFKI